MVIVALIGIDGCGKTTQAKMLVEQLKSEGYNAFYVRPIYVLLDILPQFIRNKVLKKSSLSPRRLATSSNDQLTKNTRFSLFALVQKMSVRLIGFFYVMITCLYLQIWGRNKFIVCDRYFIQFLIDLYGKYADAFLKIIPMPDVVFYIKGDISLLRDRMDDSFDLSVREDYYSNIIEIFNKISVKHQFVSIDASMDQMKISDIIFNHLIATVRKENSFA